jgi:DinB superfamily
MIRRVVLGTYVVIAAAGTAGAQGPAQQGPVVMTQYLQNAYGGVKRNLAEAANKLSEADYAFKPTTMPEVRTFGQLFGHVANAQFGQCAAAKGVPNPNMGTNNEQKTTKAENGYAAVYLRAKNVVPPSTDEQPQRGRGAGPGGRGQ